MKKAVKIIRIAFCGMFTLLGVLTATIVLAIIVLWGCFGKPAAPVDYQTTIQTGGELEAKYLANGEYAVSCYEKGVWQGFGKYLLHYPSQLTESADAYPVVVLCNGTGTPLSRYPTVANHFASWGFIVIGTEEKFDWDGFAAEMCLRFLERLNGNETLEEEENLFYGKIDLENVGVIGHSQGGVGALNAVTAQRHSRLFKAVVSLSPTNKELASKLMWDYDATQIDVPVMLISGAGGGDDWVVTGEQLEEIYDDVPGDKLMLRRKNTRHGETLYSANGYATAWFRYWLRGDEEAGKAFLGDCPEIVNNNRYQDVKINWKH